MNLRGGFNDTITLGNGAGDTVNASPDVSDFGSKYDTITLGNGAGDTVSSRTAKATQSPSAMGPATR